MEQVDVDGTVLTWFCSQIEAAHAPHTDADQGPQVVEKVPKVTTKASNVTKAVSKSITGAAPSSSQSDSPAPKRQQLSPSTQKKNRDEIVRELVETLRKRADSPTVCGSGSGYQ